MAFTARLVLLKIRSGKSHDYSSGFRRNSDEAPSETRCLAEALLSAGQAYQDLKVLELVPYKKMEAKRLLIDEFGWRDYGGKHYESVFTRFYQGYILPTKYGIDKRKAHLSNLICNGEITRAQALEELSEPTDDPSRQQADKRYVAKKLGWSEAEFEDILGAAPPPSRGIRHRRPAVPSCGCDHKVLPALRQVWPRDPESLSVQIPASQMPNLNSLQRKAKRFLHRLRTPIRPEEMRSTLDRLIGKSEILFVHCSLSSCGRFTAGPSDVLRGLGEFCDTLLFPTHTYCYPTSPSEAGCLFDRETTPSKTGLLTEMFRKQPGATRSIHATHSLAASGALAQQICGDHHRHDTPCGAETPYSRLVMLRASVLLFGVTFHPYTLFHTAEDASGSDFAYERETLDRLRVVDRRDKHHNLSTASELVCERFELGAGRVSLDPI